MMPGRLSVGSFLLNAGKLLLPGPARRWLREGRDGLADLVAALDKARNPIGKTFSLNVGGGNWYRRGWKNVDYYCRPVYRDIEQDLLADQALGIEAGVVNKVFCSHLIEHLTDENARTLFQELFRIMVGGAILRIACPDADKAFEAYRRNERAFFECNEVQTTGDLGRRLVNFFASYKLDGYSGGPILDETTIKQKFDALDALDFIRFCVSSIPGEATYTAHINGYNFDKLSQALEKAGFTDIRRSVFQGSSDAELRGPQFDNRPNQSLYVECSKPPSTVIVS